MSPADQSQRQVPTAEVPATLRRECSTGPMHPQGTGRPRWVPKVGEQIWGVVTATASLTVTLHILQGYARAGWGLLALCVC